MQVSIFHPWKALQGLGHVTLSKQLPLRNPRCKPFGCHGLLRAQDCLAERQTACRTLLAAVHARENKRAWLRAELQLKNRATFLKSFWIAMDLAALTLAV